MDETTAQPEAATTGQLFGDDDLGKLQAILIGDHARQTGDRIDTLEKAVLGVLDDLRSDVAARFDKIEAKLEAEADVRSTAVHNLTSRISGEATARNSSIKDVSASVRSAEDDLNQAIEHVAAELAEKVDELRASTRKLAAADKELGEAKLGRDALAQILSAAAADLETTSE